MLDIKSILSLQLFLKQRKRLALVNFVRSCPLNPHNTAELYQLAQPLLENDKQLELFNSVCERTEQLMAESTRQGIFILSIHDQDYPLSLKTIDNPPLLLFVKGNKDLLQNPKKIAIIGTRTPSEQGLVSALKISSRLAQAHFIIVSGLALGCDTAAHQGCLNVQGKTIAVLAHGLDTIYPRANQALANAILGMEGCLVSEYPIGFRAEKYRFVERNRIQSGLSQGVIVIETGLEGGTMHTAQFAKRQNRALACLSYSDEITQNNPAIHIDGNKSLIKNQHAFPLTHKNDVWHFIDSLRKDDIPNSHTPSSDADIEDAAEEPPKKKTRKKPLDLLSFFKKDYSKKTTIEKKRARDPEDNLDIYPPFKRSKLN